MKKAIYRTLNYIFFLFVGVGLLWLVLKGQDLHQIWQDLKNAKYSWIFISLIFAIISFFNRSIRWNLLINSMDYKPKLQYTFTALLTGYFANLAIPRIGEVTRCGILSKKQNIPFDLLLGTVIAERLFDFICLVIIIFITFLCQLSFLSNFINQHIILPFTNNIHS
ncbi:MAG: lysylphosphatidylglycerol synthase transmembrane domain-containing protein, partial [Bacteroidota bacterium]|nr:lysylphosphatidylglycerol synthase transmembrane domain-containing protein [Bacteroidota bacterium]